MQGPAPGGGYLGGTRRVEPGKARGSTDGLGSQRRSWRGGGASSALRRTGRGRSGARRAAAMAAAPSAGLKLPRCASLGVPRCRAPPGPAGQRPGVRAGSGTWGSAMGHGARGGPPWGWARERGGGGLGSGRRGELAGSRFLHSLSRADTRDAGPTPPAAPPPQKKHDSSASHWLRRASCRLSWELCWSDRSPEGGGSRGGRRKEPGKERG